MKVLSIIHYPGFGGPYNSNMRIFPWLAERGVDLTVMIPDEPGDGRQRLEEAGMDVIAIPLHRFRATSDPRVHLDFIRGFPSEIAQIRRIIHRRQFDLVMLNGLINPHGAIAARLEGAAVVWQFLDTRPSMNMRRLIMPLVLGLSDVIMSTGRKVAREHPGAERFGERLISFYPPVDTERFRPSPELRKAARARLGVPEDAFLIGTVGNVNPQKGYEYLIRAAAGLKKRIPDQYIRVIGPFVPTHDGYRDMLIEQARQSGLLDGDRLRFCGSHSAVETILPAFDIFVMSAVPLSEGITTAVLEAMSCGLPVVTTDAGSISEAVEEGVTGFIVPPLNPEELARAIHRTYIQPGARLRMGENARRHAVSCFGAESCAKTHAGAFEAAVANRRSSGREKTGEGRTYPKNPLQTLRNGRAPL